MISPFYTCKLKHRHSETYTHRVSEVKGVPRFFPMKKLCDLLNTGLEDVFLYDINRTKFIDGRSR